MSRASELMLAALVATGGISAMIWWPKAGADTSAGEDPITRFLASLDATTTPVADVTPATDAPAPAPEPETEPEPEPELTPEQAPDAPPHGDGDAGTAQVAQTQDDTAPEDPALSLGDTPSPEPAEPEVVPGPIDDAGVEFTWMQPGDLAPGSGTGQAFQINYAPGIRFPLEAGRAFANSQVYAPGGLYGASGGQCDGNNYSYAWRDNFCETRGYSTPMCPTGHGHQGQDIRPATCENAVHWAVAVADGTITAVGAYSVRLTGTNGIRYTYLHLARPSVRVRPGDQVRQGERIGRVSDAFNGTPTTIHLHFEIRMAVDTGQGIMNTPVPPYMALVDSYERLIEGENS